MADKKKKKQNPAMIIHMVISMIFGAFLGGYIAGKFLKPSDSSENQPDFLVGFIILLISIYALSFLFIIIHEAGHLVMGLLTGYKYLSFRVGSIVLQKTEQGMKFKKYSIAGTGGQCLMVPPDMENPEDVPYFWYNFGGGLFNLLTAVLCVPFLFIDNSIVRVVFITAIFLSVFTGLTNLIPLNMGVPNDGMNILAMAKSPYARGVFYKQFKANAMQTDGVRLKDMPERLFEYDENQKDCISVAMPAFAAARLMDEMKFAEAEMIFEKSLENPKLPKFYVNEYNCEMLFCKIVNGVDKVAIDEIYDKELQKYVKATGKTMITRRKLMYAYYLICEKNAELAEKEYQLAYKMEKNYPNVGEAKSELEMIEYVKANFS